MCVLIALDVLDILCYILLGSHGMKLPYATLRKALSSSDISLDEREEVEKLLLLSEIEGLGWYEYIARVTNASCKMLTRSKVSKQQWTHFIASGGVTAAVIATKGGRARKLTRSWETALQQ